MAKRVSSESQQEYKKEIRRIQRLINKVEKEGYIFPEDVVPKIPKRVTKKALEKIKAIKASDIYKSATFVGKKATIDEPKKLKTKTPKTVKGKTTKAKKSKPQVNINITPQPSDTVEPTTLDMNALKRSQAGKKAWATRRAKMSDEQYADYIKAFTERMAKARASKAQPEEYYPTKSAIEEVTNKLIDLERGFTNLSDEEAQQIESMFENNYYPTIDHYDETFRTLHRAIPNNQYTGGSIWRQDKQDLLSIWNNTLERNKNNLMALENYLIDHMQEIEQQLFVIRFASKQEQFHPAFGALGTILNQGALTAMEAEQMHNMSEYYGYDELDEIAE